MLINNLGIVVLTRIKFLHVDIRQIGEHKSQKQTWELYQDQYGELLKSESFSNYLRRLLSEIMIKLIDSDLEERKSILIKQGLNEEKIKSSEWYQLLAFDKILVRSFDNFISIQQDYLLGFAVEAAAQVFAILSNCSIIEFYIMLTVKEF